MQYLLTQAEFGEIYDKHHKEVNILLVRLQDACTLAAEHVKVRLDDEEPEEGLQPWGCVMVTDGLSYCDKCPVQKLCPNEHKRYSK